MRFLILVLLLTGCATTGTPTVWEQTVLISVGGEMSQVVIYLGQFRIATIHPPRVVCVRLPYPGRYSLTVREQGGSYIVTTVLIDTYQWAYQEWNINRSRISTQLNIEPSLPQQPCKEGRDDAVSSDSSQNPPNPPY